MWGIIPAAGRGSRIQPLAFSKELLPVGSRRENGRERPCAVSEYLLERMVKAGVDKVCFVISPGKSDIMEYFGASYGPAAIAYVVQPEPLGLCDAIFRAVPLIGRHDSVVVGLPDTIWFPADALTALPDGFAFLLFPVKQPQFFDAVVVDETGRVTAIEVKQAAARMQLDLGRLPPARRNPARSPSALASARPRRRVRRHAGQCLDRRGRRGLWHQGRHGLCRCRHLRWLSHGDQPA